MQWFVKEGDQVKQFDRLCEVQSDKVSGSGHIHLIITVDLLPSAALSQATVEITSRYDGIIRTAHHKIGSMVKVG